MDPDGREIGEPKTLFDNLKSFFNNLFSLKIDTSSDEAKKQTVEQYNQKLETLETINDGVDALNQTMAFVNPVASVAEVAAGIQSGDTEKVMANVPMVALDVMTSGKSKGAKTLISLGDYKRIENAATRIGKTINVVGSRAEPGVVKNGINTVKGTVADWDYAIDGLTKKDYNKIKNSLPGAKSIIDNTPRRIDFFKNVEPDAPYVPIKPKK